jgi:nucleoside-diphosphate-sugar epimerase
MGQRTRAVRQLASGGFVFERGDLTKSLFVDDVIHRHKPEAIIHLGEQSSAPFSMIT